MKKGTRLISKLTKTEVVYVGRNKKDKTLFRGVCVVDSDYSQKVGFYTNSWTFNLFKTKP